MKMRIIKDRKELLAAIENGERFLTVEGMPLLLQCKLASIFNGKDSVTKAILAKSLKASAVSCGIVSGTTIISLSVIAVVGAIAIIAVLKDKNLTIEVKDVKGNKGMIVVN